jgi:galactokinase/mevalonate kinase-like predicted kinase
MIAEATAPTRIVLAADGSVTIAVAIDRRAFCRVETGGEGIRLESKDLLVRAEGRDLASLAVPHALALAAHVLKALGIERGMKVVTQSRVAAGSGLGGPGALGVAVAAAASRAAGREPDTEGLWRVVAGAEAQAAGLATGPEDALAAIHGGVLAIHREPSGARAVRLATDPGRVEESLVLVDAGPPSGVGASGPAASGVWAGAAPAASPLGEALAAHRYADLPRLIEAEWEARRASSPEAAWPVLERILEAARSCGGAARACGPGGGGMVAAWAPPGRRADLEQALASAGFRPVPFRLDLRGLEVD